MIECSCGENSPDYEAWMEHVRGGMPPPPLVRKPNYRRQQKERMQLVDYIERHRILKNDNLDNGKEENL